MTSSSPRVLATATISPVGATIQLPPMHYPGPSTAIGGINKTLIDDLWHGTGCTLASAITAGLAQQMTLQRAVERAVAYVDRAIASAPGFGGGHGPINHAHPLDAAAEDWFAADAVDETVV